MLQEAEVTVAPKYLCMDTMLYEEGEIITDDMLCAAGHRTDACQVKTSVGMLKDFSFSPFKYGWDPRRGFINREKFCHKTQGMARNINIRGFSCFQSR